MTGVEVAWLQPESKRLFETDNNLYVPVRPAGELCLMGHHGCWTLQTPRKGVPLIDLRNALKALLEVLDTWVQQGDR